MARPKAKPAGPEPVKVPASTLTPIRFTPDDLAAIERIRAHYRESSVAGTVRRAVQLAELFVEAEEKAIIKLAESSARKKSRLAP